MPAYPDALPGPHRPAVQTQFDARARAGAQADDAAKRVVAVQIARSAADHVHALHRATGTRSQ